MLLQITLRAYKSIIILTMASKKESDDFKRHLLTSSISNSTFINSNIILTLIIIDGLDSN
jgi:hypothetical protein